MNPTTKEAANDEEIPLMQPGRLNIYSAADIKRWGVQRFLDTVCAKEPVEMPDFEFTEEEQRQMDEILRQECEVTAN